jgi:hypothetical protein
LWLVFCQYPINIKMGSQPAWGNKKNWSTDTCDNTKWKKPGTKDHILYDFISMKHIE